jgi:hypothetical protein
MLGIRQVSGHFEQVESLGYATSVHRLGEYVEMHAVPLANPEQLVLVRDGDGDDAAACYRCACALAEAVGIDLRDA